MHGNNNDNTIKGDLSSGLKDMHEPKSGNKMKHEESNNPYNKQDWDMQWQVQI